MGWFDSGKSDAQQNKGPKNPNEFKSSQEREKYNAGYNEGKK
jgi:hypothetical protein